MTILDLYYSRKIVAQPWGGGYIDKFIEMLDGDILRLQNDAYELAKVEQLNKDMNSYLGMFPKIPEEIKTKIKEVRQLSQETLQRRGEGLTRSEPGPRD